MSQREVNAISGRLSLRPPQTESLAKLASAIEASPAMLQPDLDAAGLELPCILRFRLTTIPNDLILRQLGILSAIDRLACELAMAEMIAG